MKIAVIGGGISGLSAALSLEKAGASATVFEASARAGGMLRTELLERPEGRYVLDRGPDSILTTKHDVLEVLTDLGLEGEFVSTRREARGALVAVRHDEALELMPIPEGFHLLAPARLDALAQSGILSRRGMLRVRGERLVPVRQDQGDESLGAFVRRRYGAELLERLAQPLAAGIYGTDPDLLSLNATFPRFIEMERRFGSVTKGLAAAAQAKARGARYGLFVSFREGMGTLPRAMESKLSRPIRFSTAALEVSATRNGAYSVNGAHFDGVICATTAHISADLLTDVVPEAAAGLASITHGSGCVATLAFKREDLGHALGVAGFLVPASESIPVVACTLSSEKWPERAPDGVVLLRVFLGGHAFPNAANWPDEVLLQHAISALETLLRLRPKTRPLLSRVDRWVRRMPRFMVGHQAKVSRIMSQVASRPGLAIAGNALFGVGIPDSLESGRRAAQKLLRDFSGEAPS